MAKKAVWAGDDGGGMNTEAKPEEAEGYDDAGRYPGDTIRHDDGCDREMPPPDVQLGVQLQIGPDRKAVADIICRMLDNPDKHGLYPTSTAFTELELYVQQERMRALGYAFAFACILRDKGEEPATYDIGEFIKEALSALVS